MPAYRPGFVHLLYAIILAQFVAIAVLLAGFSNEYLQNVYFRAWVDIKYPWLGSLLQGQAEALLIGMALGAAVLLIQRVRAETTIRDESRPVISGSLDTRTSSPDALGDRTYAKTGSSSDMPEEVLAELDRVDS
jgi:hypothetical protein